MSAKKKHQTKSRSNSKPNSKFKNIIGNIWARTSAIAKTVWNFIKETSKKAFRGFMSSKTFWSAFVILVILLIISIIVLSIRLHDYSKIDDRAVSLRSTMDESLNVFSMEYKNDAGEITIQGNDGQKVRAPGTDVEYTLRLRNTDKVALNYCFSPELNFTSNYKLPIVVRLLDPEDNYVIGNETTWVAISEIDDVECSGTLMQNETAEYVFQWKWPFESGDDKYDSFLGSATLNESVGLDLKFSIHAEANTDIAANGGFFKSPFGNVFIVSIIFILIAAVIALLLVYIINWLKEKRNSKPIIVEVPVIKIVEKYIREIAAVAPKESFSGKMAYVNIDTLDEIFHSGDRITIGILKRKGIIPQNAKQMKILARSAASLDKAFIVETQGISKNAKAAICKAGGRVIITAPDTGDEKH